MAAAGLQPGQCDKRNLSPLTNRSRDNFPNPKARRNNPYVPVNMPALDDLFDAFDFASAPVDQPYIQ